MVDLFRRRFALRESGRSFFAYGCAIGDMLTSTCVVSEKICGGHCNVSRSKVRAKSFSAGAAVVRKNHKTALDIATIINDTFRL
jgi:hypothetical protein